MTSRPAGMSLRAVAALAALLAGDGAAAAADLAQGAGTVQLTIERGRPKLARTLPPDMAGSAAEPRQADQRPAVISIARFDPGWARVTFDRASDLVGTPLARVVPRSPAGIAVRAGGRASLASLPSRLPLAARLTSGFGLRQHPLLGGWRAHTGLDLAAPWGTPVRATSDGVVRAAGWQGGYGLLVALDHMAGLETRYAHLARISVGVGQTVKAGDVVGFVGSTGRSTGPHLHYETRVDGAAIDPLGRR